MMKQKDSNIPDIRPPSVMQRLRQYEDHHNARINSSKQKLLEYLQDDFQQIEREMLDKKAMENEENLKSDKFIEEAKKRADMLRKQNREYEDEMTRKQAGLQYYLINLKGGEPEDDLRALQNPNLGISSGRIFTGEDTRCDKRKKKIIDQQKTWLEEQMEFKRLAKERQQKTEQLFNEAIKIREERLENLESVQTQNYMRMQQAIADYNKNLAIEKESQRKQEKAEEHQRTMAEFIYKITDEKPLVDFTEYNQGHAVRFVKPRFKQT